MNINMAVFENNNTINNPIAPIIALKISPQIIASDMFLSDGTMFWSSENCGFLMSI